MDDLAERTLRLLRESGSPMSTKAVADRLDVDWHTAKKRLDSLEERDTITSKRFQQNLTLWWDKEIPV